MSETYKVTGYCKDETIYETKVTYIGVSETHHYGDEHLGEYDEFVISYPVEDRSITFTATPKENCVFVEWEYHVGSPTAPLQTSTDNPFTYSEHKDIYIAAVGKRNESGSGGGEYDGDWTFSVTESLGTVTLNYPIIRSFGTAAQNVLVYPVIFDCDGIALIYANSETDRVKSYLSTSLAFDAKKGEPLEYDFYAECDGWKWCSYNAKVIKGVQYYVWFRSETDEAVTEANCAIEMSLPKWSWDVSTGYATDEQIRAAYLAVTKKLATKNFSHNVWNDLCYRVKSILQYKNDNWNSTYATYTNTQIQDGSEYVLTADKFNSLRYNIGIYYSTGINEVSTGDYVYGSYFTTLADCINNWIDTLV